MIEINCVLSINELKRIDKELHTAILIRHEIVNLCQLTDNYKTT